MANGARAILQNSSIPSFWEKKKETLPSILTRTYLSLTLLTRSITWTKRKKGREKEKQKIKREILTKSSREEFYSKTFSRLRYLAVICDDLDGTDDSIRTIARSTRGRSMYNAGKLISETRFPSKRPTSKIGDGALRSAAFPTCKQTSEKISLLRQSSFRQHFRRVLQNC